MSAQTISRPRLVHPRIAQINARLAHARRFAPVQTAPVSPQIIAPQVETEDDIWAGWPFVEWPTHETAPDTRTTPAPLALIESEARAYEKARADAHASVELLKYERETLRNQLAESKKIANPAIYGTPDEPDTTKIERRLRELDEMLTLEDDDDEEIEVQRPGSEIVFRGSAKCDGESLHGVFQCNQTGDFKPVRASRQFGGAAILPFWGELPSGSTFYWTCDGHRKQVACVVLETVLGADPETAPDALSESKRLFRKFAASFLNDLPVEATFSGAQVWAWIEAQQEQTQ